MPTLDTSTSIGLTIGVAGAFVYYGWVVTPKQRTIAAIIIGCLVALAFSLIAEAGWGQHAIGTLIVQCLYLTAAALAVMARVPQKRSETPPVEQLSHDAVTQPGYLAVPEPPKGEKA